MLVLYYASLNLNSPKAKAFILLNSSACFLERHDYKEGVRYKEFDSLKQVVQAHDSKTLVRLFTHLLVDGSLSLKDDRRLLKQVYNVGSLAGWKVLSKGLDYLEALDLRAMLNAIQLPVLWVLGEKDVLISASSGDALAEKNTGFTVKTIPGMGHYPFGIFAEKVTAIIVDYVSSLNENKNSVSKS
jgi:pimeloyl-ACP methyl ester carboxylesterase